MIFSQPLPFTQAMKQLAEKALFPTDMSSDELRGLDKDIRARSLFSARTTNAGYLQDVQDTVGKLLNGETNGATARAALQDQLDALGYDPQRGFPGEEGVAPPAERGSLRDLSSDARLRLVLETNVRQSANFAYREQGTTPAALYQYPAWELVRLYPRRIERGEKAGPKGSVVPDPGEDWLSRWEKAGGQLYDGRMIALKDDDVWEQLGDSGNFDDALDTSTPPFAFNSGMGWRQVDRDECISLGVLDPDDDSQDVPALSLNDQLQTPDDFDPDILGALKGALDLAIGGGRVRLANRADSTALRNRATLLLAFVDCAMMNTREYHRDEHGRFASADTGGGSGGAAPHDMDRRLREGRAAMERVLSRGQDEIGAIDHPTLGKIDLRVGKPGSPPDFKGGFGISKIVAKRDYEARTDPELRGQSGKNVARAMVDTVLLGKVGEPYDEGRKVDIRHENFQATLARNSFQGSASNPWLLTGFIVKTKGGR